MKVICSVESLLALSAEEMKSDLYRNVSYDGWANPSLDVSDPGALVSVYAFRWPQKHDARCGLTPLCLPLNTQPLRFVSQSGKELPSGPPLGASFSLNGVMGQTLPRVLYERPPKHVAWGRSVMIINSRLLTADFFWHCFHDLQAAPIGHWTSLRSPQYMDMERASSLAAWVHNAGK